MIHPRKELFLHGAIFLIIVLMVSYAMADDDISLDEINSAYLHLHNSTPNWHTLKYDWHRHRYEEHKIRELVLEINKNEINAAVDHFRELNDYTNYYLIYTIAKEAYASDPKGVSKIVSFINKLPWCNHHYAGYEFLFDEFKYNNQLHNSESIQFAYQLKKFLESTPDCLHVNDDKYIIARTRNVVNDFPAAIRNVVWSNSNLCIKNNEFQEHLYAASCCTYDNERRRVFTWIPKGPIGSQGGWSLEYLGSSFLIKSNHFQERLYAANCCKYDSERRNVFTWIPKGEIGSQGEWALELIGGSNLFRIRSTYYNEYLYAATCCFYDDQRRGVFTWIPKGDIGPQGAWEISPC